MCMYVCIPGSSFRCNMSSMKCEHMSGYCVVIEAIGVWAGLCVCVCVCVCV